MASVRYGEVICAQCVRVGDGSSPGVFGDYALCPRCHGSVTSKSKAFFVEHLPASSCDPVNLIYRCAVCREDMSPLGTHHCSNAAIAKILDTPAGR
jgi:uncharacterized protein with PIN domain